MSAKRSNTMWKLDLLEAKFSNSSPRFPHTKKLLLARNKDKLFRKMPASQQEAEDQIQAYKHDFFTRKYHGSHKKLSKEVSKAAKADLHKWKASDAKKDIVSFLSSNELMDQLITSKLVKIVAAALLTTKDARSDPPKYISSEIREIIADKDHAANPSNFFISHCQNNKALNNYISSLWNLKEIKALISEIDWSFRMVRGDLTKQERDSRKKATGKDSRDEKDSDFEESESDEDDDTENVETGLDPENFDNFAVYDKMVVGSEDEDEKFELDETVNYNEVTDEEPSEESGIDEDMESESEQDDFFEDSSKPAKKAKKDDPKPKKEAFNLPELASGYYSGGSDDESDIDNDKVVKEATTQRKNRRGQRARQKIWEQKYGKEAKHVKTERVRVANEREQRQLEYEERVKKREAKAALLAAPTGTNTAPLGERKPRDTVSPSPAAAAPAPVPEKIHPSWEAKKREEERLKNIKFSGKKITFD